MKNQSSRSLGSATKEHNKMAVGEAGSFAYRAFFNSGESFMRKVLALSLVFCLGLALTSASVRAHDPKAKATPPAQVKKPGAVVKAPGSFTLAVALSPDGKILARAGTGETAGQTVDL